MTAYRMLTIVSMVALGYAFLGVGATTAKAQYCYPYYTGYYGYTPYYYAPAPVVVAPPPVYVPAPAVCYPRPVYYGGYYRPHYPAYHCGGGRSWGFSFGFGYRR